MKLIDLLVRELNHWPDDVHCMTQDSDGDLNWHNDNSTPELNDEGVTWKCDESWMDYHRGWEISDDWKTAIVTRDQYESALAALQKVEWSGDGLPTVGCECEYHDSNGEWYPVTIKYASDQLVVISGMTKFLGVEQGTEIARDIIIDKPKFRPLRSEEDKKRDKAAKEMTRHANNDENRVFDAGLRNCLSIYDAIAAGKIPGVKLDD